VHGPEQGPVKHHTQVDTPVSDRGNHLELPFEPNTSIRYPAVKDEQSQRHPSVDEPTCHRAKILTWAISSAG